MNDRDIKALVEAAVDVIEPLDDLIRDHIDPGSNSIIALQRLRTALAPFRPIEEPRVQLSLDQLTDRVLDILGDVGMLEAGVDGETSEIPAGEPAVDVAKAIVEGLVEQRLLRSHPDYVELDRQIVEVLQYVSSGRGYIGVTPYPDSTARAAMGRIELLPGGSGLLIEPYVKPGER